MNKISEQTEDQALETLHSTRKGLNEPEAAKRLGEEGKNELTSKKSKVWAILFRQTRSPLLGLLFLAAIISFLLQQFLDSLTIAAILLINTALGFFQEYRSEKSLEKLRSYITSQVVVLRGGEKKKIARAELVTGDIVELLPGDIVPGDLRLIEADNLTINESILTGEVYPKNKISKKISKSGKEVTLANLVYMGTEVVSGFGLGVVFMKGKDTKMGQIAKLTSETTRKSSFEENTNRFSRFILRVVLVTLGLIFLANLLIKGSNAHPVDLLLFAIALAVSVIPEALPIVTTITLSQGALQLVKKNVVIKRLSAMEDLGHIEVLCSDKTGTLTENKLEVEEIASRDPENCLRLALFASETISIKGHPSSNSFDEALVNFKKQHSELKVGRQDQELLKIIPFDPQRKRVTAVIKEKGKIWLISKGAPEEILRHCRLSQAEKRKIEEKYHKFGIVGWRSIAVAAKEMSGKPNYSDKDEEMLNYSGLIGYSDPLKKSAKEAIRLAEKLNVRVKILTGDSGHVAGVIAHQVGITDSPNRFIEGHQIAQAKSTQLLSLVENYDVFARVTPEQKYQIIQAIQTRYAVGFLGEGINDAPALKLANASLVVNNASDVAKEAADVILLKKDLGVIVDGIRHGREVFTNIDKYIKYTLIGNFGNFYSIAAISLLIPFLPLLPIQILLTNLLTDLPLISISTDKVDLSEVTVPKKFNIRELAFLAIILGLTSSFFDFFFFGIFHALPEARLQTLWFVYGILTELILIFSIRTVHPFFRAARPSFILFGLVFLAGSIGLLLPFVSFGQHWFHFSTITFAEIKIVLFLGVAYFFTTEAVKLLYYNTKH